VLSEIRVTDPGTSPWSFGWLRKEIAEPPAFATRTATWMFGERNGVAVVVRPAMLPGESPYVAVVAEIDPPILAGLHLLSHSLVAPFRFQTQDTGLGIEPIDRAYAARAHDIQRAQRLFERSAPHDTFMWNVGVVGERNPLRIDDRTVASWIAGAQPSQQRIDDDLDLVSTLARGFAERLPLLPERAAENEARESWGRAAAGWSLSFDRARWRISGENEGRLMEAVLEGIPPAVSTIVRVSFRMPLGAGVFVRNGIREKDKVSASSHPELDQHLLFDARDRDRALAALADPEVRSVLAAEARVANVALTDWSITSARGGFMRGRDVSAHFEALASIIDRVTPNLRGAGPFR
jgi:hypothetical protein